MNEELDNKLRTAVRSQAESVQPTDRLGAIRARTRGGSAVQWWRRPSALATGAALVAASVVVAAVSLVGPGRTDDPVADSPPVTDRPEREVTVYEVGEVHGELMLYPEQLSTEDTGDPVLDAVRALLGHETAEGRLTFWDESCAPLTGPLSAGVDDNVGYLEFTAVGGDTCDLDQAAYHMRWQQLAWTVKAAIGLPRSVRTTAPTVSPFTRNDYDGSPSTIVAGLDGSDLDERVVWREGALSPVLLQAPADGAAVSGPVRVEGSSDTFEANVQWEVTHDDTVVDEGITMGGTLGTQAPFRFTLDLEPGEYTVRVFALSMKEGSLVAEDTTTFTVE